MRREEEHGGEKPGMRRAGKIDSREQGSNRGVKEGSRGAGRGLQETKYL